MPKKGRGKGKSGQEDGRQQLTLAQSFQRAGATDVREVQALEDTALLSTSRDGSAPRERVDDDVARYSTALGKRGAEQPLTFGVAATKRGLGTPANASQREDAPLPEQATKLNTAAPAAAPVPSVQSSSANDDMPLCSELPAGPMPAEAVAPAANQHRPVGSVEKPAPQDRMSRAWSNLQSIFKLSSFRPHQRQAIEGVLGATGGRDTLLCLATGGGKSLCFQLPATVLPGVTIVVSPLIALMEDQVRACCSKGIETVMLNSNLSPKETAAIYARLCPTLTSRERGAGRGAVSAESSTPRRPTIKLLYVTPEGLGGQGFKPCLSELCRLRQLSLVAIDEAHCISSWGHDFRPAYRRIHEIRRDMFPTVPVIALTATANQRVRDDIISKCGLTRPQVLVATFNRPNITYEVRYKRHLPDEDVGQDIVRFLNSRRHQCGIIYCVKKDDCELLAQKLQFFGFSAAYYHAGMKKDERTQLQRSWTQDEIRIMVATVAFGMGIDKPDVRFVIHHTISKTMEGFYQESGRAGRDGAPSVSLVYYGVEDKQFYEFLNSNRQEQARQKAQQADGLLKTDYLDEEVAHKASFEAVINMCQTARCRRETILHFFGEVTNKAVASVGRADICKGTCDYCKNPDTVREAVGALERDRGYTGGQAFSGYTGVARRFGPGSDEEVGGQAAGSKRAGLYASDEDSDAEGAASLAHWRAAGHDDCRGKGLNRIKDEKNIARRRLLRKTLGQSESEDEDDDPGDVAGSRGRISKFGSGLPMKSVKNAMAGGFTRASDLLARKAGSEPTRANGGQGMGAVASGPRGFVAGSNGPALSKRALAEIQRRSLGSGAKSVGAQGGSSVGFVKSSALTGARTGFVPPALVAAQEITGRAQHRVNQTAQTRKL